MLRFIHISDTHIGISKDHPIYGRQPYPPADELMRQINALPFEFDFILHTGDVVADPDPRSSALAEELFSQVKKPMYFVTGNHDSSKDTAALPSGDLVRHVTKGESFSYFADVGECRLLVIDAKAPAEFKHRGWLEDDQFAIIEQELAQSDKPLIIGVHYPARPQDCSWLNQEMLLDNGDRFHALVAASASKIVGVFSGHTHRSQQILEDGVLYCSVGSSYCGFRNWPTDESYSAIPAEIGLFNVVTVEKGRVTIKQYQAPDL
jgi:3',5'-cyclic AMP phosphodiesterase CpdA